MNSESREVYRFINPLLGSRSNPVLKQIDEDISNCYNIINILKLNDTYTKLVLDKLLDFNIEKQSGRFFEEILRIIPYSIREDLYLAKITTAILKNVKILLKKF